VPGLPDVVELCRALVRIPSVGEQHGEAGVVAHLAELFSGHPGCRCEVVAARPGRPNLLCTIDSGLEGPTLLLNGHTDTVAPGPAWTRDPYGAELDADRVWGVGAADMKGGLAALAVAALGVLNEGGPRAGRLIFAATADEDAEMAWGVPWLLGQGALEADVAIVAEAAGRTADFDRLALATRGYAYLEIEVRRPGLAHASSYDPARPHAVATAAALISALEHEFRPSPATHELYPDGPTVVAGYQFEGGEALGRLAERAAFSLGVRLLPGARRDGFVEELTSFVTARAAGCEITVRPTGGESWFAAGMALEPGHPLALLAADAIERSGIPRPRAGGMSGFSEAAFLGAAGIPTLPALGPGISGLAHGPDEWVSVDGLRRAAAVHRDLIAQILREDSPVQRRVRE
jgi:succinyl-diaminopimelate desuccinylase